MPAFSRFLRYFVVAAQQGSIRKASEELHISASAIDRQILLAEQRLGVALFERLPSGLRLTAAGEILLAAARGWEKDLRTVTTQFDDLLGLRGGQVRIAIIDALTKGLIPRLIERLQNEHRFITTNIAVMQSKQVADAIVAGEVDFGLMLHPQSSRELLVRAHTAIHTGFVTLPGHPIAQQATARFSDCALYPIVAPAEPLAVCEPIRGLEMATGVAIKPVAASDNIEMIKSLVKRGVGVGLLSALDVTEEVGRGELAFTRFANAAAHPLTLALCVDRARQLSGAARLLLGWMETALDGIGQG